MSYARFVRRFRFAIVALWVAAVIAATLFLPNLTTVVSSDGSNYLPSSAESVQASKLLDQIGQAHPYKTSALVAIVAQKRLTGEDRAYLRRSLAQVDSRRSYYGVDYLQDAATVGKANAAAFVSKDGTTEIGLVGFASGQTTVDTTDLARLKAAFATPPAGTKVYFTGSMPIGLDNINISMQGVARTVKVTVALVLIILILVLRSAVAPFIDLLTIGVSFLVTSGVVAWLAGVGLPVSTFTQTFLIAVLFGAGTDYSIILLNRFREELANAHGDVTQAIGQALRGVGKTLLFASLTVMVSFAVLFFAHFGLYRSGAPVAIGVAITLLACLTLIPALFAILGEKLFWPRKIKPGAAHRTSRLWEVSSRAAVRRPWWTIGLLAILLIPVALLNNGRVSFNTLDEIPQAPSVHGFKAVAKAFGEGAVLPVDVVLHTSANLRSPAGLATIDEITRALKSSGGVLQVDSATQPTGTVIRPFELADQDRLAAAGLATIQGGVRTLGNRLDSAGSKLAAAQPGVERLVSGAHSLSSGAGTLAEAVAAADGGAANLASGARQLAGGAARLQTGLASAASGTRDLYGGAQQLSGALEGGAQGATKLAQGTSQLATAQTQEASAARALANAVAAYARAHPSVAG
ncbi:MAG: efflux RND transporter permease subunit, partial [Firmicutes bacterium]|nr:efflux RND transporter permease subunit [Bacillota bacterium]